MKIDLAAVGGLTPAVAIGKACQQASIAWSVNVPRQLLPATAALALAAAAPDDPPAEFSGFEPPRFISTAPAGLDQPFAGGSVTLDESPGSVSVDRKAVVDAAVEHAVIG